MGWSAVGGVLTAVGATSAVALASQPSSAGIPTPVIVGFGLLAAVGAYVMVAPLLWLPPWRHAAQTERKGQSGAPSSDGPHGRAESSVEAAPPRIDGAEIEEGISLGVLQDLLTEGEAMLEDSNVYNAAIGRRSQYGPATLAKVENWTRRVVQALPDARKDEFRFPGAESLEERTLRLLKEGPEAEEVNRLRRHVRVFRRIVKKMWGDD